MSTQLFAGHTDTVILQSSSQLIVTPTASSTGVVKRMFDFATVEETAFASAQTFGPFLLPMALQVSCLTGQLSYSTVPSTSSALSSTEFTQLTDVFSSYAGHAGRVPIVNAAEDGLDFYPSEQADAMLEGGANGGNAHLIGGTDGGNAYVTGGSNGGNVILVGGDTGGQVILGMAQSAVVINSGTNELAINGALINLTPGAGGLVVSGLPTSDPAIVGAVYVLAGVMKVSAG